MTHIHSADVEISL